MSNNIPGKAINITSPLEGSKNATHYDHVPKESVHSRGKKKLLVYTVFVIVIIVCAVIAVLLILNRKPGEEENEEVQNNAPVIEEIPPEKSIVNIGEKFVYQIRASDQDGDTLYYYSGDCPEAEGIDCSKINENSLRNALVNEFTGFLEWTPTEDQIGIQSLAVFVTDEKGKGDYFEFSIEVLDYEIYAKYAGEGKYEVYLLQGNEEFLVTTLEYVDSVQKLNRDEIIYIKDYRIREIDSSGIPYGTSIVSVNPQNEEKVYINEQLEGLTKINSLKVSNDEDNVFAYTINDFLVEIDPEYGLGEVNNSYEIRQYRIADSSESVVYEEAKKNNSFDVYNFSSEQQKIYGMHLLYAGVGGGANACLYNDFGNNIVRLITNGVCGYATKDWKFVVFEKYPGDEGFQKYSEGEFIGALNLKNLETFEQTELVKEDNVWFFLHGLSEDNQNVYYETVNVINQNNSIKLKHNYLAKVNIETGEQIFISEDDFNQEISQIYLYSNGLLIGQN